MTSPVPHDSLRTSAGHAHADPHAHGHVHLDEADWAAYATQTELQGEVFLSRVTDTIAWIDQLRDADAPPVRRVVDIGSGPGVATCVLAESFPAARVTAVDASPTMLDMATERAARLGLTGRVGVRLAELPEGVAGLGGADVIWASMSLHHIGDETGALRVLGDLLSRDGLLAIVEMADPTQMLPDTLDIGRPGFAARLYAAGAAWFADMRDGLADAVASSDLASMVGAAGLEVAGSRIARSRFDAPLDEATRRVAHGELLRARAQLGSRLEADDLQTLDILCDEDDPHGAMHREDLFMESSCLIVIARRPAAR